MMTPPRSRTRLRKIKLSELSLVDRPANPHAVVVIAKRLTEPVLFDEAISVLKFNPNHVPSGPSGGQFAPGKGGGSGAADQESARANAEHNMGDRHGMTEDNANPFGPKDGASADGKLTGAALTRARNKTMRSYTRRDGTIEGVPASTARRGIKEGWLDPNESQQPGSPKNEALVSFAQKWNLRLSGHTDGKLITLREVNVTSRTPVKNADFKREWAKLARRADEKENPSVDSYGASGRLWWD